MLLRILHVVELLLRYHGDRWFELRLGLLADGKIGKLTEGELTLIKMAFSGSPKSDHGVIETRGRRKNDSSTPEWDATVEEIGSLLESMA